MQSPPSKPSYHDVPGPSGSVRRSSGESARSVGSGGGFGVESLGGAGFGAASAPHPDAGTPARLGRGPDGPAVGSLQLHGLAVDDGDGRLEVGRVEPNG